MENRYCSCKLTRVRSQTDQKVFDAQFAATVVKPFEDKVHTLLAEAAKRKADDLSAEEWYVLSSSRVVLVVLVLFVVLVVLVALAVPLPWSSKPPHRPQRRGVVRWHQRDEMQVDQTDRLIVSLVPTNRTQTTTLLSVKAAGD